MQYANNPSPYDGKALMSLASRIVSAMYNTRKECRTSLTIWTYDGEHRVAIFPSDTNAGNIAVTLTHAMYGGKCTAYLCVSPAHSIDGQEGVVIWYGNMYGGRDSKVLVISRDRRGKVLAVYPDTRETELSDCSFDCLLISIQN